MECERDFSHFRKGDFERPVIRIDKELWNKMTVLRTRGQSNLQQFNCPVTCLPTEDCQGQKNTRPYVVSTDGGGVVEHVTD